MSDTVLISHRYRFDDGKGDTIAHLMVFERNGVIWFTDLWVHPDYRKQGRARRMMDAAIEHFQSENIYLEAQPYTDQVVDLAQLIDWYRRFGFEPTDVPNVLRRRGKL